MDNPSRSQRNIIPIILVLTLTLIAGTTFGWYFIDNPCLVKDVENASTLLFTQMTRYDDVYVSAANGTRTSIDYPVNVMQQILMDTNDLNVPSCMKKAKVELVNYMDDVIRAFQAFKAGEPDTTIKKYLDESYVHVRIFMTELDTIKKCAPYCLPKP